MWHYSCPKNPNLILEFHSWHSMNEDLTVHEDGAIIPGLFEAAPCLEEHEYWDDGLPCGVKNCTIRYIRNDEPVD